MQILSWWDTIKAVSLETNTSQGTCTFSCSVCGSVTHTAPCLLLEEHPLEMWNRNVLFAILRVCETPVVPQFVERQDEGSSTALPVRLEEVSEGRIWRRNESVQWAESFVVPEFITMPPKNKRKLTLLISGIGNLRLLLCCVTEFVLGHLFLLFWNPFHRVLVLGFVLANRDSS